MLKSRAGVLLWYQTALTALESRQTKVSELTGKPGKELQLAKAEIAVGSAQHEVDNAARELNRVTELTLAEVRYRYRYCYCNCNAAPLFSSSVFSLHCIIALFHLWGLICSLIEQTQRFRVEKHKDLRQVVIEYVKLQIEDSKRTTGAWQGILEEITK
jgi:hypothetical protein